MPMGTGDTDADFGELVLAPGRQRDAASLALLCKSLADVRLSDTVFLRVWVCVCAPPQSPQMQRTDVKFRHAVG